MSLRGIEGCAGSMSHLEHLQKTTAYNLANASTEGFKAIRLAVRASEQDGRTEVVEQISFTQGPLRETGRNLDVALEGPGFLLVETVEGQRLIRGGALKLDQEGRLLDRGGAPVLGEAGKLLINGNDLVIQDDGTIVVDGDVAGKLRVVRIAHALAVERDSYGRFVPLEQPLDSIEGTTKVRQGAVEETNLDPILSLVDLLTIQRAYSANVQALRAMDGVLGATNDLGRVS